MENKEAYIEALAMFINEHSMLTWLSSIDLAEELYEAGYIGRREGKWEPYTEHCDDEYSEYNIRNVWTCSLCGRLERSKKPYCHCGAKMLEDKI